MGDLRTRQDTIGRRAARKAYVLEQGRIGLEGSGRELLADPDIVRAYLGMAPTTADSR